KELSAIFWDLKGATRKPSCFSTRHSPPARTLFPALDMVPCIMIDLATVLLLSRFIFSVFFHLTDLTDRLQQPVIFLASSHRGPVPSSAKPAVIRTVPDQDPPVLQQAEQIIRAVHEDEIRL